MIGNDASEGGELSRFRPTASRKGNAGQAFVALKTGCHAIRNSSTGAALQPFSCRKARRFWTFRTENVHYPAARPNYAPPELCVLSHASAIPRAMHYALALATVSRCPTWVPPSTNHAGTTGERVQALQIPNSPVGLRESPASAYLVSRTCPASAILPRVDAGPTRGRGRSGPR